MSRPRDARRDRGAGPRTACAWCGYDHDVDAERPAAQAWHANHDAGAGLRFETETLKGGHFDAPETEDEL